ncbi:unnamed protein product, partial [Didymodactylos carnosus]
MAPTTLALTRSK